MNRAVKRKIFFYRAVSRDQEGNESPVDFAALFKRLKGLPDTMQGRSMSWDSRTRVTTSVDSVAKQRLLFGKTRLTDMPYEEDNALKWSSLKIGEGGGTVDVTHVAFYPNGIVGNVRNGFGPSMRSLAYFLTTRCPDLVGNDFSFRALMNANALKDILQFEKIRSVHFEVEGHIADLQSSARAAKPLLLAAADVAKLGGPLKIGITISQIEDEEAVKSVVSDLGRNGALADDLLQVKVSGSNYHTDQEGRRRSKTEVIDLLADDLMFEEKILALGENGRTLDDGAAWNAVDTIYREKRTRLEAAPHIQ